MLKGRKKFPSKFTDFIMEDVLHTREQGTYSGQDQPIKTTRTNGKLIPRILDTEAVQSGHIFLEEFDSSMQAGEATSLRHTAMNREIVLPSSIVYVPSFV